MNRTEAKALQARRRFWALLHHPSTTSERLGMTDEQYHEMMESIHIDQDDKGYFDEPWWLDMEEPQD